MPSAPSNPGIDDEDDELTPLPPPVQPRPRTVISPPTNTGVQAPASKPAAIGSTGGMVTTQGALGGAPQPTRPERYSQDPGERETEARAAVDANFRAKQQERRPFAPSGELAKPGALPERMYQSGVRDADDEAMTDRRAEIARRRQANAQATEQRKTSNAQLEAEMRGTGQQFYTDAFGEIQPVIESGTGRAMYHASDWEDGGEHPETGEPTLVKRDKYGQRQYKAPQLTVGSEPTDDQLYYNFGNGDLRPAGSMIELTKHQNPKIARMALAANKRRIEATHREALAGVKAVADGAKLELESAKENVAQVQGAIEDLMTQAAAIPPDMLKQSTGGVMGIGATPTPQALAAQQQKATLEAEAGRLNAEMETMRADIKPGGRLARAHTMAAVGLKIATATAVRDTFAAQEAEILKRLEDEGGTPARDALYISNKRNLDNASAVLQQATREQDRFNQVFNAAPAAVAPTAAAPGPTSGWAGDMAKRVGRSLVKMPGQMVESAGMFVDALGRGAAVMGAMEDAAANQVSPEAAKANIGRAVNTATPGAGMIAETGRAMETEAAAGYEQPGLTPDPARNDELLASAADSAGSLAGAMVTPGGVVMKTIAGAALNAQGQASEARQTMTQRGATPEAADTEALSQFVANLPAGALESMPWANMLKRFGGDKMANAIAQKYGKSVLARVTGAVFGQAALEGGEEALQQIWGNAAAQAGYDPDRALGAGVGKAAAVGAVMGGGLGGAAQGGAELLNRKPGVTPQEGGGNPMVPPGGATPPAGETGIPVSDSPAPRTPDEQAAEDLLQQRLRDEPKSARDSARVFEPGFEEDVDAKPADETSQLIRDPNSSDNIETPIRREEPPAGELGHMKGLPPANSAVESAMAFRDDATERRTLATSEEGAQALVDELQAVTQRPRADILATRAGKDIGQWAEELQNEIEFRRSPLTVDPERRSTELRAELAKLDKEWEAHLTRVSVEAHQAAERGRGRPSAGQVSAAETSAARDRHELLVARREAIEQGLNELEQTRKSPASAEGLRGELEAEGETAAADARRLRTPDLESRRDAIEDQLTDAERLRRSERGGVLLERDLAQEESAAARATRPSDETQTNAGAPNPAGSSSVENVPAGSVQAAEPAAAAATPPAELAVEFDDTPSPESLPQPDITPSGPENTAAPASPADVSKMAPGPFMEFYSKANKTDSGRSLTGDAHAFGREHTTPEQIEDLKQMRDTARELTRIAMEQRSPDAAGLAYKGQFLSEAYDIASKTGTYDAARDVAQKVKDFAAANPDAGKPISEPAAAPATPDSVYDASRETFKAASRKFTAAQKAFRAKTINAGEFLAARNEMDAAQSAADEAESAYIDAKNAAGDKRPGPREPGLEAQLPTGAPAPASNPIHRERDRPKDMPIKGWNYIIDLLSLVGETPLEHGAYLELMHEKVPGTRGRVKSIKDATQVDWTHLRWEMEKARPDLVRRLEEKRAEAPEAPAAKPAKVPTKLASTLRILGPRPPAGSSSWVARGKYDEQVKAYSKLTAEELAQEADKQEADKARTGKINERARAINDEITAAFPKSTGGTWKTDLTAMAKREGLEDFSWPETSTRGDALYNLAKRLAEREESGTREANKALTPAPAEKTLAEKALELSREETVKKGDLVTVKMPDGRSYPKVRVENVVDTPEGRRYQVDVFGTKFVKHSQIKTAADLAADDKAFDRRVEQGYSKTAAAKPRKTLKLSGNMVAMDAIPEDASPEEGEEIAKANREQLGDKSAAVVTETAKGPEIAATPERDGAVANMANPAQLKAQKDFLMKSIAIAEKTALEDLAITPKGVELMKQLDANTDLHALAKKLGITEKDQKFDELKPLIRRKIISTEGEHVTFDVPGDGTFTVPNTKAALKAFAERIKSRMNKTTSDLPSPFSNETEPYRAKAPTTIPAIKKKPTTEDLTAAAELAQSDDDDRFILQRVFADDGFAVATSGIRMHIVAGGTGVSAAEIAKLKIPRSEAENKEYYKKTEEERKKFDALPKTPAKYPDWKAVLPKWLKAAAGNIRVTGGPDKRAIVDTGDAVKALNQALAVIDMDSRHPSVKVYALGEGKLGFAASDPDFASYQSEGVTDAMAEDPAEHAAAAVDPIMLREAMQAARLAGHERVTIYFDGQTSPVAIVGGNNFAAIAMPISMKGPNTPSTAPTPTPKPSGIAYQPGYGPGAKPTGAPTPATPTQVEKNRAAFEADKARRGTAAQVDPTPPAKADLPGEKINSAWTAYGPDSKSLGVPRAEMPQIKSEHRGALAQFLAARGIRWKPTMADPAGLRPTQAEFSPAKVQKARDYEGSERPILVSQDGHVVDGHHQWMAALDDPKTPIPVIRLEAPIDKVLAEMKEFPSTESAAGAAPAVKPAPAPAATVPLSDRVIKALQDAKINKAGTGKVSSADPISLAWDAALEIAILAVRAGRKPVDAMGLAVQRYKAKHPKATSEDVAKLETRIRDIITPPTPPTTPDDDSKRKNSLFPESLKAAGAPAKSIQYDTRGHEARRDEAAAILRREGRGNGERLLRDQNIPRDTRVAIGGNLIAGKMLELAGAAKGDVQKVTRELRKIVATMQPELATESGQAVSMFGGIYQDVRVAAGVEYLRHAEKEKTETLGGADVTKATDDAIAAVKGKSKIDAEKAIEALKKKHNTKPAEKVLDSFKRKIDKVLELDRIGALERDDMTEIAAAELGIKGGDPGKLKDIADTADRITKATTHAERARAELELADKLAIYKGISRMDVLSSLLTANVLSGYTTQLANIQGNFLQGIAQLTTTAAVNPRNVGAILKGFAQGLPLGLSEAESVLRTGRATRDFQDKTGGAGSTLQTVDFKREFGVPGVAGDIATFGARAVEKIFRFMKAADAVFYYPAREAYARLAVTKILEGEFSGPELAQKVDETLHVTPAAFEAARAQAAADGYTGIDLARRTADIIEEQRGTTDAGAAAVKQSEQFGAEATFTQEPVGLAGVIYHALKYAVEEGRLAKVPVLKPWLMFLKTPTNVFNEIGNWTAVGAMRAFRGVRGPDMHKAERKHFSADERNRLYLKAAVGTAIMVGLANAMADDDDLDITATGPTDGGKRKQLQAAGWTPFSFRVGDRRISYKDSPLLIPLAFMGHVADAARYQKSQSDLILGSRMADSVLKAPQVIFETSMLTGVGELMAAARDGDMKGVSRTLSSIPANLVIPYNRLLQQIDQSFDKQSYQAAPVVGSVPFARRAGKPLTDVQGRPAEYNPLRRFTSVESNDPVDVMLRSKNIFIPEVGKDVKLGNGVMDEETRDKYRSVSGARIRARLQVNAPRIRLMTEEKAQDEVSKIASEEREKAKAALRFSTTRPARN